VGSADEVRAEVVRVQMRTGYGGNSSDKDWIVVGLRWGQCR
jgi:hypothetical protein